jgi:hypothetical protein
VTFGEYGGEVDHWVVLEAAGRFSDPVEGSRLLSIHVYRWREGEDS